MRIGERWSVALLRGAMWLHPARIRDDYGEEMVAAFRSRLRERREAGRGAALAFTLRSVTDVARSGLRARRDSMRREGGMGMGEWWSDLKLAIRTLRRSPGFTAAAVLVLALGIGANAAIFSAVKGTLLAPPPFPEPDRLVLLDLTDSSTVEPGPARAFPWSYPKYRLMAGTEDRLADPVAAFAVRSLTLTGAGDAAVVRTELVTPDYFDVLGVTPVHGREFGSGHDAEGAALAAVLSHGLWTERFGADPGVVGTDVTLNDRPVTVLGVAPAGFTGLSGQARLWMTVHGGAELIAPFLVNAAQGHWLRAVGRLRDGATLETLNAQMAGVGRATDEAWPETDPTVIRSARAQPLSEGRMNLQARRSLVVLSAAAGLLLLVGWANLAGLLVARTAGRRRETAVRIALGADRWRVVRTHLTESLVLAGLGGVAAVLVARVGVRWLVDAWPARFLGGSWNVRFADLSRVQVDGGVLVFAAAVAVGSGALFGLFPALSALRTSPSPAIREGGGSVGRNRRGPDLRSALVAAEICLALVLVVGAGLLVRSLRELQAVPRGYEPGPMLVFDVSIPRTSAWADDAATFHEDLLTRLEALPGVESAAMGCVAPLSGHCMITGVREAGDETWPEGSRPGIGVHYVSDAFFETLGIELLRGRTFGSQDQAGSPPVVVLSRMAARDLFGDENPLGQGVSMGTGLTPEGTRAEVVGVVDDVLFDRPENGVMPEAFVSHRQDEGYGTFFLRTRGEPLAVLPPARAVLAELDPDIPASSAQTLREVEARAWSETRVLGGLLSLFAGLALLLACTGVWAVVSYAVTHRTRELGLRMALGADPGEVVGLVLRKGIVVSVVGVVLGAGVAWLATRILTSLLFEVEPSDPVSFALGALLLVAVASLAAWLPARRATRVDPMRVLQAD